jgi:UDPglucose 6-dehydrogenase
MSEKYTIGIIGFGFVGKAIQHGFAQAADFCIHDVNPLESIDTLEDTVYYSDFIFVCVPTPTNFETGEQDNSIVDSVVDQCAPLISNTDKILVIKTTTVPGTTQKYIDKYPQCHIVFNPEFLTERTFRLDFINQSRIVLGGKLEDTKEVEKLYRTRFPTTPVFHTSATAGEMVKYFANCFFACKVAFMNEMYQFCEKLGIKYDEVIGMVLADGRIGNSHWQVPGHDGHLGFGGKCLSGKETITVRDSSGKISVKTFEELYDSYEGPLTALCVDLQNEKKLTFSPLEGVSRREVNRTIKIQTDKGYKLETTPDHRCIVYNAAADSFIKKEVKDLQLEDQLPVLVGCDTQNLMFGDGPNPVIDLLLYADPINFVVLEESVSQDIINLAYKEDSITIDQKCRLQKNGRLLASNVYSIYKDRLSPVKYLQTATGDRTKYHRFLEIDKQWARLIGYYLAEGSITGRRTYFSFNCNEKEYIQDVCSILKEKGFGCHIRVQNWKDHPSCTVIIVNWSILAFILKKVLGCGSDCYNKRMPDILLQSKSLALGCLESFIKGDGSIYGAGRKSPFVTVNIATSSRMLSEQLGLVIRMLGTLPTYRQVRNNKSDNLSYQWDISRKEDVEKLLQNIKLNSTEQDIIYNKLNNFKQAGYMKPQRYKNYTENIKLVKVKKIEPCECTQYVYSTQITGNENFITSGGLLVSNCFPKDLNALMDLGRKLGIDPMVMEAAWKKNLEVRKDLDWYRIKGAVSERKKKE